MENGCWRFQWATMWFLQSVSGVTAGAATEAAGYIECPEPARLPTRHRHADGGGDNVLFPQMLF
jgi:hypothetical protein